MLAVIESRLMGKSALYLLFAFAPDNVVESWYRVFSSPES